MNTAMQEVLFEVYDLATGEVTGTGYTKEMIRYLKVEKSLDLSIMGIRPVLPLNVSVYRHVSFLQSMTGEYYRTVSGEHIKLPSRPKERDAMLKKHGSARYARYEQFGYQHRSQPMGIDTVIRVKNSASCDLFSISITPISQDGKEIHEKAMSIPCDRQELRTMQTLINLILES